MLRKIGKHWKYDYNRLTKKPSKESENRNTTKFFSAPHVRLCSTLECIDCDFFEKMKNDQVMAANFTVNLRPF